MAKNWNVTWSQDTEYMVVLNHEEKEPFSTHPVSEPNTTENPDALKKVFEKLEGQAGLYEADDRFYIDDQEFVGYGTLLEYLRKTRTSINIEEIPV